MADSSVLDRALAKRKRLIRELERVPAYQELVRLDDFIATYRELAGGEVAVATTTRSRRRLRESLPDVVAAICAEADGPIPVGELVSLLAERDRPVGGKNPKINLSSVLSRDPRFNNVAGRGWQLTENNNTSPSTDDEARNDTGASGYTEAPEQGG